MIFAFKILVMVMIIRISIATGYQPVFWGAFFGAISAAESLVFGGGIQSALINGLVSGVIWGLFLWVLSKLEGRGIWWWFALIAGLLSPLIVVGTLVKMSESKKQQGEYSAPNTHSSGPESARCAAPVRLARNR